MGKLRTAINDTMKTLDDCGKKAEPLLAANEKTQNHIVQVSNTAQEAWDSMLIYLTAKFKKANSTVQENEGKTIKEVIDAELATYVKGLESYRQDLIKQANAAQDTFLKGVEEIDSELTSAAGQIKTIRDTASKKSKKWLASKDYKAKIASYMSTIDSLDGMVKTQSSALKKAKTRLKNEEWVNKWFKVDVNMTVADIKSKATMDTNNILKEYSANSVARDSYVRKWRDEYKGMAGQLATMKKWSDDADALEKIE